MLGPLRNSFVLFALLVYYNSNAQNPFNFETESELIINDIIISAIEKETFSLNKSDSFSRNYVTYGVPYSLQGLKYVIRTLAPTKADTATLRYQYYLWNKKVEQGYKWKAKNMRNANIIDPYGSGDAVMRNKQLLQISPVLFYQNNRKAFVLVSIDENPVRFCGSSMAYYPYYLEKRNGRWHLAD